MFARDKIHIFLAFSNESMYLTFKYNMYVDLSLKKPLLNCSPGNTV